MAANGLVKRFGGIPALNGVGFEVECGEAVALLGPSGAGKSTMLRSAVLGGRGG